MVKPRAKGTRFGGWALVTETRGAGVRHAIRRWYIEPSMVRKYERYPIPISARSNDSELASLLTRLNDGDEYKAQRAKKRVTVEHAYINDALLLEFERFQHRRTDGSARVTVETGYLVDYVIFYFVQVMSLPNPKNWRGEEVQYNWWQWLKSDQELAPATCRDIVGVANRFISWLRERRGAAEVPEFKLAPVTGRVYERQAANYALAKQDMARTRIPADHWQIILGAAGELTPYLMLGYAHGLRRAEIVGIKPGDAQPRGLIISRTLKSLDPLEFETTKSAEPRRVPYWYATQEQTREWAEYVTRHRLDPDTLTKKWDTLLKGRVVDGKRVGGLGLPRGYSLHDLRHTFITRAANEYPLPKVQRAAGHSDIRTTMGYYHDEDEAA